MKKSFTRNPWLIFSPFLLYYGYLIIQNKWPTLYGDEIRYMQFAKNLTHGFYSPFPKNINLWNGPGYPIILIPFVALHIPDIYTTLMNAVYEYLAVLLLYKAVKLVTNHKTALIAGLLLAIYPNALSMLPILYTEAFTMLLVSLLIYTVTLYYKTEKYNYIALSGLVFGFLTLTKIIFGYVIILGLVACLVFLIFKKRKANYKSALRILIMAFGVTVPYLTYTYHITGKVLYWGDSGGMSLYWMSTPYNTEYGDWKLPNLSNNQYPTSFKSPEGVALLKKNHAKELSTILKYNELKQDELFKQQAIINIKTNPLKFARNYYYNFSRMLFNFPYSYSYQDAGITENILIGSLTLWLSLLGIVITARNWRKVIYPVKFLLLITGLYLLFSGTVSAYPRQLNIIIPVLLFWMAYLINNIKKPDLKFDDKDDLDEIELPDLAGLGIITQRTV
ncbi:MAG: ArnT family glycosyltransferase [Mucilaginibacter sp.]